MKIIGSLGVFIVVILFLMPVPAAPEYPDKPIILQVAAPAGGVADLCARILADAAERQLGCNMVVINKPGAGQQVGFTELARQKPDGYYIGQNILPHLLTIILDPDRKATFNLESFTPIVNQVVDPGLIYVKADSPYKTLIDFIDDAKKRPGKVVVAATGILGDDHLAILMLQKAAGVEFRIVQFLGNAPQVVATLGGQVDVSFDNVGALAPKIKAGQLRGLAVLDNERSKFVPDVPTAAEKGYPSVISASSRGVMGPKGLPESIVKKLQNAFKKAMEDPGFIDKMAKGGMAARFMGADEYAKYIRELNERVKPLVADAIKTR